MFAFGSSRAPWYMGGKPMKAAVGFADESSSISLYVVNTLVSFHLSPCSPASPKDPLLIREGCRALNQMTAPAFKRCHLSVDCRSVPELACC